MDYSWITNNCHDCNLCDASCVQCMPKGSNTPLIYFVGDALNPEETDGVPFTGKSGKYLHDIISPLGLDENNCRFFNIVRCVPRDGDNFRSPNQNEMDTCIKYFLKDIEMTNPRVIVTLGNTPIKALFPDMKGGITKNRGILKKYNNFYVIPTLHPSYLIRQMSNTSVRLDFKKDISLAKKISMDFSVAEAILDSQVLKDSSSSTVLCKSYKEFEEFCANEIDDATDVAYDVETNAEEVHNVNHRIVGFSIASNKDTGCYVPLDSLDFKMDGFDKELIEDKMRDILTTKNIIVYNCQHEYPATLNWLNVEIKSLDDIFVMVKLMMGQAGRYQGNGGLKAQSVMHLGYTDWSEDLDIYFEYVRDYGNKKEEMRNLLSKYYDDENELSNVIGLVENAVYNELIGTKKDVISYGYVPYKLVGRYGSIDSSVLFELRKFYYDWMDRDGETLGINLHQGYRYWMWHTYSGYTLERNAAYWNDEYANKVEKWCNEGMVSAIKAMIASPLSESILKEKLYDKFLIYLKDNYIDEIFGKHYTVKKSSKKTVQVICNDRGAEEVLARMSIYPDAKGICKLAIGNVETLAKRFLDSNPNLFEFWFKQYITDFIGSEHTIKEYTELLNPGSTSASFKDFVSKILITPDVRFAKMYTNLVGLIEEPDFNIDAYKDLYDSSVEKVCNYVKRSYNFDITEFLSNNPTVTLIDNVDSKLLTLVDKLKKDPDKSPNEKYKIFLKMATSGRKYYSWKINKAINSSIDYKFECLDAGVMNEIYELYRMLGVNVDDRSTWTEEFTWFYNYKMYKKFAKIISTYIWGATGRANVYYADKESARNDVFTRREDLYDGKDHPDKLMFMQQSFQINMADTGRWKCFTGDTRIKCLDGKSYSFKELVDNGISRLWVYAVNGNGDIIPAIAINPVITKVVNRVLKITLDNGEVIRCTPDHKFMLGDGSYKEARLLTSEDSLMSMYLFDKNRESDYNHKIKFIEYEDIENCEMYDIEVPEFHNFALDCGVFVHNCGMHNLPAGETIKSIFTSRFKGGCVGMPDGSQMEIRTLAAECKDEGLLKAFEEKLDIHRYFASMIYKVEYDKVEKWQRSLAKNAVFGMIYGESEKTFADSYLNGDLERAREVFDGMFKGFPKIKEYIERAQGQYKKFNRVTTLTQRFINLNDPKADPNRMLRQAQNFPIQAAAEDIAGIILYKLCEFLKENNMKSKPFCFIHDSIEIDMHPDEVFQIVDKINWLFNVFPRQEFGAYVACDVPLGPSMGQEIEIKDMVHDEKYNDVSFILDGYVDDIEQQLNIWREVYDVVECEKVEGEEDSEQYQSYSVAFLPKKSSVSMYMGTNRSKGVRKIHVIRKVEQV